MKPVTPTVVSVGWTEYSRGSAVDLDVPQMDLTRAEHRGENLIEFAGRTCYDSYGKPNPKTADNRDYIANVISQKHFSVLEHVSISFYVGGISRNALAELTRHRHFSYSVLSSRYVDPFKAGLGYVVPPNMPEVAIDGLGQVWEAARHNYYECLDELRDCGVTGKKARETARAFLPGSLETRMVVTGNLRSWIELVSKRDHPAADAEMREVASLIYKDLVDMYPAVFGGDARASWDAEFSQGEVKHGS